MKHAITLSIAVALALGVTAGASHAPELKPGGSVPAAQTSDDVVVQWNEIAVTSIGAQPPFPSGRFMAIVQLAVFEAVNAISGKYEPYLGTVTAPTGASTEAAAITAAHGVLKTFPGAPATLDQQRDASLALIPDGQAKTDGITVGEAAAAAMIAERTGDGSTPAQFYLPTNSDPYQWQLTTPSCSPAGGAFVHWANVSPFGVLHSAQFRADPPPALASEEYANDFREVQALGDINSPNRTPQNTNVARIYGAQPPHVGWNSVARQIIAMRDDEITDTARVLALMNMSLADGHISVFESKYFYRTWRPQTAIPRADEDGNAGTTPGAFTPLINTPCFPGYPSAHGVGAGAASRILWKEYGRFHTITNSHPSVPGVVLNYSDLLDIVKAVSDARVNGGIHFRSDQDGAERQGKAIAQWNLDNRLRPR